MSTPQVQVSGIGAVSCVGISAEVLWASAFEERSGIVDGLGVISPTTERRLRELYPRFSDASRPVLFAQGAISEALTQSSWNHLCDDDGLIVATTTGQIPIWENPASRFMKNEISSDEFSRFLRTQSLGSMIDAIASQRGFSGRSFLITSACSASTQAIALAVLWLKQRRVKRCLVGGTEVLCNLTLEGFRSLQLLSRLNSVPFDSQRTGINLSEGAGFLCLELSSEAKAPPLAHISGLGLSSDSYHMTAPHPEGQGSFQAMREALKSASLEVKDVSWIHAHGTGSKHNDQSEGKAIARLFEDSPPWVSSTKWIHGHALGASGAIETVLCIKAIEKQTVLKTSGLQNPDPEIRIRHPGSSIQTSLQHILKNTLGFGGNNAALVISAPRGTG